MAPVLLALALLCKIIILEVPVMSFNLETTCGSKFSLSESELFTGDTSEDNLSPGPVVR